jgi:hypothetical protein
VSSQGELDFSEHRGPSGLDRWRENRQRAERELARRLGLPLGHPVEVWLSNGIRLRGLLQLSEERLLFEEGPTARLALRVDGTTFDVAEMASCTRQD